MALVFYARVSSKGKNLARQLARAKEVEADKVFTDKFSGKTTDRPGLHELFSYVREGDTVELELKKLKQIKSLPTSFLARLPTGQGFMSFSLMFVKVTR